MYLAVVVLTILINLVLWVDGSVSIGSIGSIPGIFTPVIFYFLALHHCLTQIGSRCLKNFRPLLDVDDTQITQIDYEFSTLPRWLGWVSIPVGFILATPYLLSDPATWGGLVPKTSVPLVVAFVIVGPFLATVLRLLACSIRQLRAIRRIHSRAKGISKFNLKPGHAFSVLTARRELDSF
jgi:hypothetical protein